MRRRSMARLVPSVMAAMLLVPATAAAQQIPTYRNLCISTVSRDGPPTDPQELTRAIASGEVTILGLGDCGSPSGSPRPVVMPEGQPPDTWLAAMCTANRDVFLEHVSRIGGLGIPEAVERTSGYAAESLMDALRAQRWTPGDHLLGLLVEAHEHMDESDVARELRIRAAEDEFARLGLSCAGYL